MIKHVTRGVAASALGTLSMDLFLYRRYRREGGESGFGAWESSAGLASWEDAPAPAKVGKRMIETLTRRELSPKYARLVNNATHWGYGMSAGAPFGLLATSPKLRYGPPFGASVWASGYVTLPLLGVYKPIWKYDLTTLAKDLSAHLVYGTATAAAFRVLP
ncbi:hypothetical protein [Solirubrobacter soli]|uniref:hypothetical protein n=1 Tax=Solirubrobacter soli TaxID=363832 RepID=UPI00041DD715|nr:hypothetical protein [Solirubrobacter soli]